MAKLTPEDLKRLEQFAPDLAAKLLEDAHVAAKPKGWSNSSNASYYNEKSALWVKSYVDKLLKKQGTVLEISAKEEGFAVGTLYVKFTTGLLYLVEQMDPDKKYAAVRPIFKVSRRATGIALVWKQLVYNRGNITASARSIAKATTHVPITRDEDIPDHVTKFEEINWMKELEVFLRSAEEGERLVLEGLVLSPEDKETIRSMMQGLPMFGVSITASSLKVLYMAEGEGNGVKV